MTWLIQCNICGVISKAQSPKQIKAARLPAGWNTIARTGQHICYQCTKVEKGEIIWNETTIEVKK